MSLTIQGAKSVVRNYMGTFDSADQSELKLVLKQYTAKDYLWRGMHPFYIQENVNAVIDHFWTPFHQSFTSLQRREDIFFAGKNDCDNGESIWTVSMGNFLGLFDEEWLGIRPTGRMCFLRYAEFHKVNENGKIEETALFCDIITVMHQAGQYPLPPMTGASFIYPGPKTHDGILREESDPSEAKTTMKVLNKMIDDLTALNISGSDGCPPEVLEKSWTKDMIWYGPCGIGASFTIPRYQKQHQLPFRKNLSNKVFNGHIARFAEGHYAGFFGWPNLNNTNSGGFLGLPASDVHAPMRVVDIYRREGDKLAENWVFIDLLHYLYEQGLDILSRNKSIAPNQK